MALTGQRSGQVRVAGSGTIWIAPVGTAMPTDTVTAPAGAFQDLGFTDDSGVSFTKKDSYDQVKAWQSAVPVRWIGTAREVSFKFNLLQFNSVSIPLWGAGGAVVAGTGTGEYQYDIASDLQPYTVAMIIDWADSAGTIKHRLLVAKCQVTDTTDRMLARKAQPLGLTLAALPYDATTPLVRELMKDPDLVV